MKQNVVIDGKTFSSYAEAAKHFKVSKNEILVWKQKEQNTDPTYTVIAYDSDRALYEFLIPKVYENPPREPDVSGVITDPEQILEILHNQVKE